MKCRFVGLTSLFATRVRFRLVIAVTLVLGAAVALPPSQAGARQASPYLDSVATTLDNTSPGTRDKIWWTSSNNALPQDWLLQTPNCFGHLRCSQPPPGGATILQRMTTLVASARRSLDFAELYQLALTSLTDGGPNGSFLQAIVNGLRQGHQSHPTEEPVVRVLIGKFPAGIYSAEQFALKLRGAVGPWLKVQSSSMRVQLTSWNHSKVLDADGRAAIVGGMNYWTSDYLDTANPVNDLSMEVVGAAAADVSRYLNVIWSWACENPSKAGLALVNLPRCLNTAATEPVGHAGSVPVMVVGHLGNGISVPGEPIDKQSAQIHRPPLHGNQCTPLQRDISETNDSRAYEYRNPGEVAVRALIERARSSIFISQQDLLSCLPKPAIATEAKFDERLFAILANKIAAGVPITIVLSTGGSAGYSNGWTIKQVGEVLKTAVEVDAHLQPAQARTRLCQDVGLAAVRNGPGGAWADGKPFSNHAKLVAVDGEAFYIGSQNLYPGRLQELGLIVDDRAAATHLENAYIRPLWDWSRGGAVINPATRKCDV